MAGLGSPRTPAAPDGAGGWGGGGGGRGCALPSDKAIWAPNPNTPASVGAATADTFRPYLSPSASSHFLSHPTHMDLGPVGCLLGFQGTCTSWYWFELSARTAQCAHCRPSSHSRVEAPVQGEPPRISLDSHKGV